MTAHLRFHYRFELVITAMRSEVTVMVTNRLLLWCGDCPFEVATTALGAGDYLYDVRGGDCGGDYCYGVVTVSLRRRLSR